MDATSPSIGPEERALAAWTHLSGLSGSEILSPLVGVRLASVNRP